MPAVSQFFFAVTARPRLVIMLSAAVLVALAASLPRLTKDSTNMANFHPEHPGRLATDKVEEVFGLSDDGSMAVVVIDDHPGGVFDPDSLALVAWLTREVRGLPGIDPNEVTSIATEKDITGTEWGMEVEPFFEEPPSTLEEAEAIRENLLDFALYVDSLASRDGRATVIIAELLPGADDVAVYWDLVELAERAPRGSEEIHVAGVGAFNARIGEYVETDAQRLNPLAGLVIVLMLVVAYRTAWGVALPVLTMSAAVLAAFGGMALLGVPVFTLTSSIGVILIAIGICDGIHLMGQYYYEQAVDPDASGRELAMRTMTQMWRPVLMTSVTTMAGFLAISLTTNIPPMIWYGIFAALGVLAALASCVFFLPAMLALLRPRPSRAFRPAPEGGVSDLFGRFTARLGTAVTRFPRLWLAGAGILLVASLVGGARVRIDNSATNVLDEGERLHIAIDRTNATLGGVWNLDVVVEVDEAGGLYEPANLRRIEQLQEFLAGLPHVHSVRSIVDYVKQMHRSMNGDAPSFYTIPDDPNLIAQYFLAYSASSSPTDFEEVVDFEFRRANIRAAMEEERTSYAAIIVGALENYLEDGFNQGPLRVTLAGWANLGHYWSDEIARSQWLGIPAALLTVAAIMGLCFRSLTAGALSVVPAGLSVAFVYGLMGFMGIWMDFANSILAVLAVGVTVDFAVHTLDRLIDLVQKRGLALESAFPELFATTGRALLFNFAAVALGFGVLVSSQIPPLSRFGVLVVVCVASSAFASLTVLPALVLVARPRFLRPRPEVLPRSFPGAAARALVAALAVAGAAAASGTPDGSWSAAAPGRRGAPAEAGAQGRIGGEGSGLGADRGAPALPDGV